MAAQTNGAADPIAALTAQVARLAEIVAAQQPSEFPVDSYKDAAKHLRRPFAPAAVKWKVQTTYKSGKGSLVVPYIDARLVFERLNLVCPHLWDPKPRFEGGHLWCDLTIDDLTRCDIGDSYKGKGLWSDAIKRAAVHFGVGVSLYATPKQQLWANTPHIEITDSGRKDDSGKTIWFADITDQGYRHLASVYEKWLDETGRATFGEPLDHGDVVDSVGYIEGDGVQADVVGAAPAEMVDAVVKGVDHLGLDRDALNLALGSLGINAIEGDDIRVGVRGLSIDDAAKLLAHLRDEARRQKGTAAALDQGTIDSLMVGIEHLGLDLDGVSGILKGLDRLPLDPIGLRPALARLDIGSAEALLAALKRKADEAVAEPVPAATGEGATDAA